MNGYELILNLAFLAFAAFVMVLIFAAVVYRDIKRAAIYAESYTPAAPPKPEDPA